MVYGNGKAAEKFLKIINKKVFGVFHHKNFSRYKFKNSD